MKSEFIKIPQTQAVDLALSMYVGEVCTECEHEFDSVEDIKKRVPICSGKDPLTFACKECWDKT